MVQHISEVVKFSPMFIYSFALLAPLLASGENNHSGSGENNQF
jgi:hypothetical protein